MFALLEHDPRNPDGSTAAFTRHWDLLIELGPDERVATWRLSANPLDAPHACDHAEGDAAVFAERIAPHRRMYLDYHGPVSGGRGFVQRLDAGTARIVEQSRERLVVELAGDRLVGRFALAPPAGAGELRRLA